MFHSLIILALVCSLSLELTQAQLLTTAFTNYANRRLQLKQCSAALPTVSPFSEKEQAFERCVEETGYSRKQHNPDHRKRTHEVIDSYGYYLETYDNVTSKDGYILTVFRVTGGLKSPPAYGKPSVLVHHGLGTASDNWVIQYGNRNIVFKLADAGYDVWLANVRGTDYSRRHVFLNPNLDIRYWDFSFHEMGIFDLPEIIDLILSRSGNEQIFYIGHSMGCTIHSVAVSEFPELNDKIQAAFWMAPALHVGHAYTPLVMLTSIVGTPLQTMLEVNLRGRFDWNKYYLDMLSSTFCTPTAFRCKVCDNGIFFLYGYDAPQANFTNLPNILSKIVNTASVKTLAHFAQNFLSCEFRKYDYGPFENLGRYGSYRPPTYNIKALTSPTYIFYGESDNLVAPVDVHITKDALLPETVKGVFKVSWPQFNHVDFVTANDADILVYNQILEIMNSYIK